MNTIKLEYSASVSPNLANLGCYGTEMDPLTESGPGWGLMNRQKLLLSNRMPPLPLAIGFRVLIKTPGSVVTGWTHAYHSSIESPAESVM